MWKRRIRLVVLYSVAVLMVFIAVRIEILNARAGYRLPMNDVKRRNREVGGSGAWRAIWYDEAKWRRWHIREERPLTPEEEARMRREIQSANANWHLRNFVTDFGLLQYVLVVVSLVFCFEWWREGRSRNWRIRIIYLVPVVIAVLSGALAVYRGYFTSTLD